MEQKDINPDKKIGRRMFTIMWIIVLASLSLVFAKWENKRYNPNTSLEGTGNATSQTVVLKRNDMGHYVASGLVNSMPVIYMLDTGATVVSVPQGLARRLNLKPGPRYRVSTANGTVVVRGTTIKKLELGSITLYDIPASINPGMGGEEILLGMSVLKQLDFHQSGNELSITQYLKP